MAKSRGLILWQICRGLLAAIAVTLLGMVLMALAIVYLRLPDSALMPLNQALKLLSILAGAFFAVGVGGERGLAMGAAVALLYMICGYAMYCALGGAPFSWPSMLAEIAVGAAVGAILGMLLANLRPKSRAPGKRRFPAKKQAS